LIIKTKGGTLEEDLLYLNSDEENEIEDALVVMNNGPKEREMILLYCPSNMNKTNKIF